MKDKYVAPSLLAANKNNLKEEILLVEKLNVKYLHWDIMDNVFVPNTALSSDELIKYSRIHNMINDVHIMVNNPLIVAEEFANCGADIITFHIEATKNASEVQQIINFVHSKNIMVGIALKPNTDMKIVLNYLDKIDLVLVMSVEPGFGGQKFIVSSLDKIKYLRNYIDKNRLNTLIEVDGGINDVTGKECANAGADILVAGSYLFNHDDIKERMEKLL